MIKQDAIEDFLNQKVTPLNDNLYSWRAIIYEIVNPFTAKKRHNWSQYIKHIYKGRMYYIREASRRIIDKYYADKKEM